MKSISTLLILKDFFFTPSCYFNTCYCRKVVKQIPVAELQPDETVDAVREARLLAKVCGWVWSQHLVGVVTWLRSCGVWLFTCVVLQLDHPYIVKFHDSFMEGDSFCIITEYCEVSWLATSSF